MQRLIIRNAVVASDDNRHREVDIAIADGVVTSITTSAMNCGPTSNGDLVIDADQGVATAGLVNAHLHSNEVLLKGTAAPAVLEPYLIKLWPLMRGYQHLSPEDMYYCALANCAELIRSGVTSCLDDLVHPQLSPNFVAAVRRAYEDSGLRARVSVALVESPVGEELAVEFPPQQLDAGIGRSGVALCRDLIEQWRGDASDVSLMLSPSAVHRCSEETIRALADLAHETETPLHVHCSESALQASRAQAWGRTPVAYLRDIGALNPLTVLVHGVWLSDADVDLIAAAGATVVTAPTSNLKLGSGMADVGRLRRRGVNVAIGTDGNTSNDGQNMLEAVKLTSLMGHTGADSSEDWLSVDDVVDMATRAGVHAGGWVGGDAIRVGERADIVLFRSDALAFHPLNSLNAQLVHCANGRDIRAVVSGGRLVMLDDEITTFSVSEAVLALDAAREKLDVGVSRSRAPE